ncbi:MAG TPA: hypothetical protein VFT74_16400, partial [Isosphaeraceae bacterium]|nr:hypothetical protein [Isosphaeraceae bacterium]
MRELPAPSATPSDLLRSDDPIERRAVNVPTRGSRPAILDAQPSIDMLLASLRRKWLLATLLGSIAAAVSGAAVYRIMPPARHIARAMLHVAATQPNIIFNTQEIRSNFDIYKQTQLRLLKGRSVLGAVLRDPMVKDLDLVKEASKQ